MIAREISWDMVKEGGITGVAVLVETVAIMVICVVVGSRYLVS